MITKKVKTLWHGQVAVRDKYIKEAIKKQEPLRIEVGNESMVIEPNKILSSIKARIKVEDNYSVQLHELCYFTWKPTRIVDHLL